MPLADFLFVNVCLFFTGRCHFRWLAQALAEEIDPSKRLAVLVPFPCPS